jgi:hypothetical protein
MKGTLHKTDEGWIVRYIQEDPRDPLPELPLHPEYQTILPLDLNLEGGEVEFDWCVIVEHDTGKGKEYAKLIQPKEKISDEEIEMLAWKNPCLSRQDVYDLFDEVFKDKTVQGVFKISVSKEVRQFKERLRQLAKQKYREQLKNL